MPSDLAMYDETVTTFPEDALATPIYSTPTTEGLSEEVQTLWAHIPGPQNPSVKISFRRGEIANSVVEIIPQIVELLRLEPNWDSYGACAIDVRTVMSAIRVISILMRKDTPNPSVIPTSRGGIQFQWELGSKYLEIEVFPPDKIEAYYFDSSKPESEEEGEFSTRLSDLGHYVDTLTSI